MKKKRFVFLLARRIGMLQEEPAGLFQAAASIEQQVLARHFYVHAEIFALPEERDHFVGEVMHVYDHVVDTKSTQASKCDFEQGASADFDQHFWTVIGERPQARAQPGSENHCPHREAFSKRLSTGGAHRRVCSEENFICPSSRVVDGAPRPPRRSWLENVLPIVPQDKLSGVARRCSRKKP